MLKNLERKIKVTVYQGDESNNTIVYMVRYHCQKCKKVTECVNSTRCEFVRYVRERMPKTQYSYAVDFPQLHVIVKDDAEKQRALKVIERAQRLRTNRGIMRQK